MKILYVITDLAMGGAEVQLLRMCQYISEKTSNKAYLISLMEPESDEMMNQMDKYGVEVYSLGMSRGRFSIGALKRYIQLVKQIDPEVIHSHMVHANYLTRIARPFLGKIRIINSIHGEEEYKGVRKQIYRITDKGADYTVACGNILFQQAKDYRITSNKKLKYICNGLSVDEYMYSGVIRIKIRDELKIKDGFVWMTVARLNAVKNQAYLISEFAKVCEKYSNATLVIVGDGPLYSELKKQAADRRLKDNILFLGQRKDVKNVLCAADAFVLSSVHEGLPLSLQEAGAIGLPMVSTDVGGCSEIVKDGNNGFLCESNKEGALAEAMIMMMGKSKEQLDEMGKISHQIVMEKFDMGNIMAQWDELYQ